MFRLFWFSLFLCLFLGQPASVQNSDSYIVGAHYYAWYGGARNPHWPAGVAHKPWLGYYSSESPSVVQKQIDIATQYGVDVFVVGWTGIDSNEEKKFRAGFLNAPNLDRIRFCLVYDSLIRLPGGKSAPLKFDFNDPLVRSRFLQDFNHIGKQYFGHPSYFKIDGRPVIKIYLARRFAGDFPTVLQEAKSQLNQLGWDPYFVADSLYYGRIDQYLVAQFDAATVYNLNSASLSREGIKSTGALADRVEPLFWNYLLMTQNLVVEGRSSPVDFQPGVIPQYDDRVNRNTRVALLARNKEEVKRMFQVARNIVDTKTTGTKIVWITSWNEWHEGTTIEPTVSGGKKYPGGNYGFDFLEAVSEVFQ